MEIFNQLINQFSQIAYITEWNELQSLFQKVAERKPILFASMVDHPQKNQFNKMRPNARDNLKSLEEAQEILIQCGAISYCMYQLLERYEIVKEKISKINLQKKESLQKVFDDVVQPVHQLFNEIDSISAAQAGRA